MAKTTKCTSKWEADETPVYTLGKGRVCDRVCLHTHTDWQEPSVKSLNLISYIHPVLATTQHPKNYLGLSKPKWVLFCHLIRKGFLSLSALPMPEGAYGKDGDYLQGMTGQGRMASLCQRAGLDRTGERNSWL